MKTSWLTAVVIAFFLTTGIALADREWVTVGRGKASTDPVTIAVQQSASRLAIACTEGAITLHSVTVVSGNVRMPFQVSGKLKKGDVQAVSIGSSIQIAELIMHVEGSGDYEIRIRR